MSLAEETLSEIQKLINDDNYAEAIELLKNKIRETDDENEKADLYHNTGKLYYQTENYEAAKDNLLQSVNYNKRNLYSKFYLAKIYERAGDYNSAFMLYSDYLQESPESIQVYDHLREAAKNIKLNVNSEIKDSFIQKEEPAIEDGNDYPKISIILLCYNKFSYTKRCIDSIFKNTNYPNYEIVAVDNASVDETSEYLETYAKRLKYVRINNNVGFIGGNNIGVSQTDADYVVFLNNDTEVMPDWLGNLYNTFLFHPDAGGVGAKLIFANNTLQEAGAAVFNDATGWNYGRNGEVSDSRYNFVRETDYCSGAALMVRRDLFNKVGGYDYLFAPAYFEDTDLCFSIRKLGYKIYYCFSAQVIHYEGITNGTDVAKGLKRYQIINAPKFIEKWKDELVLQYPNDPRLIYQFSNRKRGRRILIIDDIPPLPDRASGAMRHYNTLKQLLELGFQVTYVYMMCKQYTDEKALAYLHDLKMEGVEFHWFNYEGWWAIRNEQAVKPILKNLIDSLDLKMRRFDFIYMAFWHIAEYFIDLIREAVPDTPVIIDSVDIHYLREIRQAKLVNKPDLLREAERNKTRELALYSKSDCVLTVTENDADILGKDLHNKAIFVVPDAHDAHVTKNTFEERRDLLFVGNFNHNPNEDAVFYFIEEIFPLIKAKIPGIKFYIVGNNPTEKIKQAACGDIIVTGWVPDVEPYLEQCKISVIPLRYGAGMKGKVGQSLVHGTPVVTTAIGAEGMNLRHNEHAFIADNAKEFAEYCVELYNNKNIWLKFSAEGKSLIDRQFSSAEMKRRLEYVLSYKTRAEYKTEKAFKMRNPPEVSILMVTYNQYNYTKQCIESIKKNTGSIYEIIVIDNASTDGTAAKIKQSFPEIRIIENNNNEGFPAAVNKGILNSLGNYILILNNDTIVTRGWLEKLIKAANTDEAIGIVGPISNSVSGVQLDKTAVYKTPEEMNAHAEKIGKENLGKLMQFPRVAFLCTLIKRKVIDTIGVLDERFTPGNFEDDDFCLRAQLSGFKTVVALDVFIHHFGSKSFKAEGEGKYEERLNINKKKFTDKWGATPDEIWLHGKEIKQPNVKYPADKDEFIQAFSRAMICIEDNELTPAYDWLKKAIAAFHVSERKNYAIEFTEVLNLTGNVALINRNYEEARKCFEEELKLTPASSRACAGLGDVLYNTGVYDSAKTMYEWGVKNDTQNKAALEGLANANSKLGFPLNHNSLLENKE